MPGPRMAVWLWCLMGLEMGCQCGSFGLEDAGFTCQRASDCRDGYVCRELGQGPQCVPRTDMTAVASVEPDAGESDAGLPDGGMEPNPDGGLDAGTTVTRLAFSTTPQTVNRDWCAQFAVQTLNEGGVVQPLVEPLELSLQAGPPGLSFFGDVGCSSTISLATMAAGAAEASFYARAVTTGAFTLTVSAPGLDPATQLFTVLP